MYNPVSTYRIQFHKGFTFAHLKRIIPYLRKLGIRTVYASPVFEAAPGSTHGYDCVNPHRINPEIGTRGELVRIAAELKEAGIGWIQDIVPNHMAVHHSNAWLMDVLRKGTKSPWYNFFDMVTPEGEPIALPLLGAPVDELLGSAQLSVICRGDDVFLQYGSAEFPLVPDDPSHKPQDWVNLLNRDKSQLRACLDRQAYRLTPAASANSHMGYRRFFTVSGLVCLRMERPEVFSEWHKLTGELLAEGVFSGLRVDHVDGLRDPEGYLKRLRQLAGDEVYIVTEKILQADEQFPCAWPVQGSTGYDFLADVNQVLTARKAEGKWTRLYRRISGQRQVFRETAALAKKEYLKNHMRGELAHLVSLLMKEVSPEAKLKAKNAEQAITTFLVQSPVYRFDRIGDELKTFFLQVARQLDEEEWRAWQILEQVVMQEGNGFFARLMQFTGPLMAKGIEDTTMYRYNLSLAHNEVGDSPGVFGMRKSAFHKRMIERRAHQPLGMIATATHDTKRGEDARARLTALTWMSAPWSAFVNAWLKAGMHRELKVDKNDLYFLLQSAIAAYTPDQPGFMERLQACMTKALREGGRNSSWMDPDEAYETGMKALAGKLFDAENPLYALFIRLHEALTDAGFVHSLAQVVLKYTCPGIPDLYQGTENWDQSFVDPDNRRSVNFEKLEAMLNAFPEKSTNVFLKRLWSNRAEGSIKLWLTHRLLQERTEDPSFFTHAEYVPLEVKGTHRSHVLAFARHKAGRWAITAVSIGADHSGDVKAVWGNTHIEIPDEALGTYKNVFCEGDVTTGRKLFASDIFADLPVACISMTQPKKRTAGILLPMYALPSAFGSGDAGGAGAFLDTMQAARQTWWQMLPVNPVSAEQAFSPYSSTSAVAGNTLFVSPDLLVLEGLLTRQEVEPHKVPASDRIDYNAVQRSREALMSLAWKRFKSLEHGALHRAFDSFCNHESAWLNDFAMFVHLREMHDCKPWPTWPEKFAKRDAQALAELSSTYKDELTVIRWKQFMFFRQWRQLREEASNRGIRIFGDMPFYVSRDSADVWTQPELFSLDDKGEMTGVAGVPPDYFSADGQLWMMPTFRWEEHRRTHFDWWKKRLSMSHRLFDMTRLDHFRAFLDFWEVPAGEATARNGKWMKGPGEEFFTQMKEAIPGLGLVAEDLGNNMEAVYVFRKKVDLPGMKVMHFGFGDNVATAVDAPHNFDDRSVAYPGTHDNNTTVGWWIGEAPQAVRENLQHYAGRNVTAGNVHEVMGRLCYGSVANIAMLTMQDVLGLGPECRTNEPGKGDGNWVWKMKAADVPQRVIQRLRTWAAVFGR